MVYTHDRSLSQQARAVVVGTNTLKGMIVKENWYMYVPRGMYHEWDNQESHTKLLKHRAETEYMYGNKWVGLINDDTVGCEKLMHDCGRY